MMMKLTVDSGEFESLGLKSRKIEIQYDMAANNQQQKSEETACFTGEAMLVEEKASWIP